MKRVPEWVWVALPILLASVYIMWPILSTPGWYHARTAYRYPYLFDLFKDSFVSGHVYPRWLPELMGGYGYPTFVYYPPGFWFIAMVYGAFCQDTMIVMRLTALTIFMIGGFGAYKLARYFGLSAVYGAFAGVVFLATPWIAFVTYFRGAFAELLAVMVCPWVIWAYVMLADAVAKQQPIMRRVIVLSASYAALIYSHPFIAFWMAFAMTIMALFETAQSAHKKTWILALVIAGVMTLCLTSPYWVQMVHMKEDIRYQLAIFMKWFLPVDGLISMEGPYLYLPTALLSFAGFILQYRQKHALAMLTAFIVLLMLITPSAMDLWRQFSVFQYTQHARRIVSLLATVQLLGVIFLLQRVQALSVKPALLLTTMALYLALCAYSIYPQLKLGRSYDYAARKIVELESFTDMTHTKEFMPKNARKRGLPQRLRENIPAVEAIDGQVEIVSAARADDITATVIAPATLRINQFGFPGWKITLDGTDVADDAMRLDRNGRMLVDVPGEGVKTLHAWYDGPPYWQARNAVFTALFLLALAAVYRFDQRLKKAAA